MELSKKMLPVAQFFYMPHNSNSISANCCNIFGHIGAEACLTDIGGMDAPAINESVLISDMIKKLFYVNNIIKQLTFVVYTLKVLRRLAAIAQRSLKINLHHSGERKRDYGNYFTILTDSVGLDSSAS